MIILRETNYSRKSEIELDEEIKDGAETFIKEILKYILMSSSPLVSEWTRNHWTIGASNKMNHVGPSRALKLFLGLVDNYKNLPRRRYTQEFAIELRKNKKTASDYVDYIKNLIRTDRRTGEGVKYIEALKTGGVEDSYSNQDLIQMCKFAALCLTNQLNPDYDNWYDSKVKTMQVDWDKEINTSSENLREILKTITGY